MRLAHLTAPVLLAEGFELDGQRQVLRRSHPAPACRGWRADRRGGLEGGDGAVGERLGAEGGVRARSPSPPAGDHVAGRDGGAGDRPGGGEGRVGVGARRRHVGMAARMSRWMRHSDDGAKGPCQLPRPCPSGPCRQGWFVGQAAGGRDQEAPGTARMLALPAVPALSPQWAISRAVSRRPARNTPVHDHLLQSGINGARWRRGRRQETRRTRRLCQPEARQA